MFQIDPVLWLQSLESPVMTWFMTNISLLGYTTVYIMFLIVLMFGVRLKTGLYIFLVIVINGIMTDTLKRGLMFPRPSDVDSRVVEPGFERPPLLVEGGGASAFWGLPSEEARAASRNQADGSYGFPSGHVSGATAFFLSLAFFFRSKRVFQFSIIWIVLMGLSRMYLGRHFVADVIGGIGVGVLAVSLAAFLVKPLMDEGQRSTMKIFLPWMTFTVLLVIIAPFIDLIDNENVGRILGLLATCMTLHRMGWPTDQERLWKRAVRVLLAFGVYALIDWLIDPLIENLNLEAYPVGMILAVCLITAVSFVSTVWVARYFKFYS